MSEGSEDSYRSRVLSSLAWHGAAQFGAQTASWLATLFVIRLLDPTDYGVMAMANAFFSMVLLVGDLGIGSAVVQARELRPEQVRDVQGYVVVINVVALVVTLAVAPLVAAFFDEPRLVPVLCVLASAFVLLSLYVVPQSLLMRDLHFDQKAKVDFVAMTLAPILSLVAAYFGLGYWSLVIGSLSIHVLRAIGFNLVAPGHLRPRFALRRSRAILGFGSAITLDRALWWMSSTADVVIAGKILGDEILGLYAVILTLSAIPIDKLLPVVTQVSFSAFSRIQEDADRVARNLLRSLRFAVLLFVPVLWGMALAAEDGLPLVLGEKWRESALPFAMICTVLPLKAVGAILPPALFATGRPMVNVLNQAILLVTMATAFLVGAQSGLLGLGWAWLIAFPVASLLTSWLAIRALEIRISAVAQALWRPLVAAALMAISVLALQDLLGPDADPLVRLIATIVTGVTSFTVSVMLVDRFAVRDVRELLGR